MLEDLVVHLKEIVLVHQIHQMVTVKESYLLGAQVIKNSKVILNMSYDHSFLKKAVKNESTVLSRMLMSS